MIELCEPKVYLIAKTYLCDDYKQDIPELVDFYHDEEIDWRHEKQTCSDLTEVAGRVCYMSFEKPRPGGNHAYIEHIKELGHGSVLEHGSFSFLFTGVSRGFSHELVRHRAGMAYSQLSTRYVDSKHFRYVMPEAAKGNTAIEQMFIGAFLEAHSSYEAIHEKALLSICQGEKPTTEQRKIARGIARSVLPTNVETKIVVTGNCRAWRNILEQRMSRGAEIEIRKVMNLVYDVLVKEEPNIFGDYVVEDLGDGTRHITGGFKKV